MKRTRRMMAVLLAAACVLAIPGSAFAKGKSKGGKGKYVPTAGTEYELNDGKWEATKDTFTAVFDKSGKVKNVQYTGDGYTQAYTYAWKGENIAKREYTYTWSNGSSYTSSTYSIKKKKPSKCVMVSRYTYDGKTSQSTTTTTYKWGKKDGFAATQWQSEKGKIDNSSSVIYLKKGKQAKIWNSNTTYTYYKNGLLRSSQETDNFETSLTEYNSDGYITKNERTYRDEESGTTSWERTTYQWTLDPATKAPTECVRTYTESDGSSNTYKWVFTASQKVKKTRNCDVYGFKVWLGF